MRTIERYRGSLLGLAAGDALGTTLEFRRPGSFEPIAEIVGGGPFGLRPGEWTDDTSMALCLAASLVERRGFDPADQMERQSAGNRNLQDRVGRCVKGKPGWSVVAGLSPGLGRAERREVRLDTW